MTPATCGPRARAVLVVWSLFDRAARMSAGLRRDAERRRKRSYLVGVELHRLAYPHWRR